MIRLPSDPEFQAQLIDSAERSLRARMKARPGYSLLSQRTVDEWIRARLSSRSLLLRLLREQFDGRTVPGLPRAVATGRWIVRGIRAIRRWN